jgi:MOSC domain-containing protein YiiM
MPQVTAVCISTAITLTRKNGETEPSGIGKRPVASPVLLHRLGLEGDFVADTEHHGGEEQAALMYCADHYAMWNAELNRQDLGPGWFGENIVVTQLDEASVHIGDRYRIGGSTVKVTKPRQPCWKLNARFDDDTVLRRTLRNGFSGWYVSVEEAGLITAGDTVELLSRDKDSPTIMEASQNRRKDALSDL